MEDELIGALSYTTVEESFKKGPMNKKWFLTNTIMVKRKSRQTERHLKDGKNKIIREEKTQDKQKDQSVSKHFK
uniref:Uncharacterized protein n=1 Tax=Romanomermis culicivorax TaxID=13658 RepID=A0A915JX62_ROMCU